MDRSCGLRLGDWIAPRVRAADLARAAGVSHQYVSSVLAGKKPPSSKLLDAARDLGIPVDALLGEQRHDQSAA